MEKILRNIVIGGIFILPFLTLYVASSLFFPYIAGKNFAFRIITEIVFFAWLALCVINKEYRPRFNWLLGTVGIFVVIVFLADVFGMSPYKSLWSNFERMEGFVTIAHLFAYFLVLASVFTEKLWQRFLSTWLISSALISVYGLFQIWGLAEIHQGGVRVDASFGNATYLAVFLLITFFISIYKLWRAESSGFKYAYAGLALLQLFVLYHTATRGAILGLFAGLLVTTLYIALFEKENKKVRKIAVGSIAAIIIVVGGFFALRNAEFVKKSPVLGRFASISFNETTTKSRFMVWNMAIEGFKERPILGYGQENFNYVFNKYYNPEMYAQEQWFDRTHSIIFDWLIAAGLLGLIAYLSIFVLALRYLFKSDLDQTSKAIFTGLLAAYFFQNLFVFDNLISYLLFFAILGFLYGKIPAREIWTREYSLQSKNISLAVFAVALVALIYFVNGRAILQGRVFTKALTPQAGKFENNLELFKDALAYDALGTAEVREHLSETANSVRKSGAPAEIKNAFYELATNELNKQIKKTPQDARHHVFAGSLAGNFGQHDAAIEYFKKARELSPKKQSILFGLGSSYLSKNDPAEALKYFKEAYELAPSFNEARTIYALGLIYNRETTEAIKLLTAEDGAVSTDPRIIKAFYDSKDYNNALIFAEAAVNADPSNVQNHISLAALYSEMGQRQKAIASLRKAIELEPSFKEQGEYYIKEIEAGRQP